MKSKRQTLIQLALFIGILFFVNVLASRFYTSFDLTEEKRFTLTNATKKKLNELEDVVYVKVLLEGDFPAGFKRLQKGVKELLDDMRSESSFIEYSFENPLEDDGRTIEEINAQKKIYSDSGILPTTINIRGSGERNSKLAYPWALIFHNGRETAVNLLENNTPGVDRELVLNNSVSLLEYKIINAVKKLNQLSKPNVVYSSGHGELSGEETATIDNELSKSYNVARIHLDSIVQIDPEVDVLIVAKPMQPFTDKDNFKIDQFVMNGGKVLWMIDKVGISLDSITKGAFVPLPMELNLDNILYNYGARIQPNLVLDMESMPIELRTGMTGNAGDYELFPWYYHPALASRSNHPVVKNLNRVLTYFPNRIDTIEVRKGNVRKEILLTSSGASRFQRVPTNIGFEILREDPDVSKFNKKFLPVAILLEGEFPSEFENKITDNMLQGMQQLNLEFKKISKPTRQIVIADGDIAADQNNIFVSSRVPLGMNPNVNLRTRRDQNFQYGNKQLILNAVEYLVDDNGVIEARSKEVKLRPLNKARTIEEKTYWQLFNILLPIVLLGLFAIFYHWNRKRKYGKE